MGRGRVFATAILLASVAAFASTFIPVVRVSMSSVWPLHLGAMATWAAMFGTLALRMRTLRRSPPGTTWEQARNRAMAEVPTAAWVVGIPGGVALLTGWLLLAPKLEGNPGRRDGRFVLESYGQVVRAIGEDEFVRTEAELVRLFSGVWVVFAWGASAFFWFGRPASSRSLWDQPETPPAVPPGRC